MRRKYIRHKSYPYMFGSAPLEKVRTVVDETGKHTWFCTACHAEWSIGVALILDAFCCSGRCEDCGTTFHIVEGKPERPYPHPDHELEDKDTTLRLAICHGLRSLPYLKWTIGLGYKIGVQFLWEGRWRHGRVPYPRGWRNDPEAAGKEVATLIRSRLVAWKLAGKMLPPKDPVQ